MNSETIKEKDIELARFLKALSHPARIAIIRRLIKKKEEHICTCGEDCSCGENCNGINCKCGCKCGEIVNMFTMSQSTVSQHIKELKSAGLISVNGRKSNYNLNHTKLSEGLINLLDLLGNSNLLKMENQNCNCGPNCQCGPDCNCGPDCQCGNGGECTCGDSCNCK